MTALDPYETLSVPRTATAAEIERAFRSRAQAAHPDRRGGSNKVMRDLNAARKLLSAKAKEFADPALDPIKRLVTGKSIQDIQRIRGEIVTAIRSFEQRGVTGFGGPLSSPQLARHRLELQYLNHLLT